MLDGPYENDTWKGREIARVEVQASDAGKMMHYSVPVPAVEGLSGKHAIFLVVAGPEIPEPPAFGQRFQARPGVQVRPRGLFDLNGIGFEDQHHLRRETARHTGYTVPLLQRQRPDRPDPLPGVRTGPRRLPPGSERQQPRGQDYGQSDRGRPRHRPLLLPGAGKDLPDQLAGHD